MARALWLPDVLRDAGLRVVVEPGWETRGSSSFSPQGMVWHHTAGPKTGNFPSRRILVEGRADLPGPLCQIGGARDGTVHVIASGRANHAGSGGWRGLTGNASVFGWEPEHCGRGEEAWGAQLESMRAGTVAIFRHMHLDARMLCGHVEWAPGRKVDPVAVDMAVERARLEVALRRKVAAVEPIMYARRGTADFATACAAVGWPAGGNGSASCDLPAVKKAAAAGADVVAVGGPADRDLAGVPHRTAAGGDAGQTARALLAVLGF